MGAIHEPGVHRQQRPAGGRYTVAIPEGYTAGRPVPLVVILHWGGPVTPYYGESILVGLAEPALRPLQAIMVAPDCRAGDWANPQSQADVLELMDYLQDTYHIDGRRTLLTGYSKGGIGTWYLAARHQERFVAALPMAARPPAGTTDARWQIPLYVIHSRQDELFPPEPTERVVKELRAQGVSIELVMLDGVTHYETGRYLQPLKAAIPWIESVWASSA